MTEEIKKALLVWAQKVVDEHAHWDAAQMHRVLRKIYEISSSYQYLSESFTPSDTEWKRHQSRLNEVIQQLTEQKENNPTNEENLEVPPMIETIKNMVTEMPEQEHYDSLFETITETPIFVPKNEIKIPKEEAIPTEIPGIKKRNLNDQFAQSLSIDLNDRLAFVKHLFQNNSREYDCVIAQIVTFESWQEVLNFLQNQVKTEYPHWEEKPDIENRFLSILQKNFDQ